MSGDLTPLSFGFDDRSARFLPEATDKTGTSRYRREKCPGGHSLARSHDSMRLDNGYGVFLPWEDCSLNIK